MRVRERKQRLSSVWTKRKQKRKDDVADVKQQKTTLRAVIFVIAKRVLRKRMISRFH